MFSGDTAPCPGIEEFSKDCDVLVHEVYSDKGFEGRPDVWKNYHSKAHTSAHELGRLASRVKPGVVVLVHQLLWGTTPDELVGTL